MKKEQFVVVGLGRFGSSLAKQLITLGYEVLGIDKDDEAVQDMSQVLTQAVVGDCTDEEMLRSLGVRNLDCGIVAIGDDIQASIMSAILLKDIGIKKVVAKALTELHGRVLKKVGVDQVVYPERDMGVRIANQLVSPNLLDYIELSEDYTIAEMAVPKRLSGKSLREINLRAKYGCSVVAINKSKGIVIAPSATDVLSEKDVIVVIGTNGQIEEFEKEVVR
ncbi:TrkA family potassium uptake protein [Paenibacillus sp. OV219]|uniref:potassium channel family protein n=1 Tax=Paenibacillus sp. OV219 TaxID=1884377 RepID=UPI0008BC288A|nr:TrkA family potassium uptake protein [Paenibacillus sp. OV219]SEP16162.1 trk system potassium uptake protein TrkA [Paenibacillus sp. OV219]